MISERNGRSAGFTLLEVLVALAIIGLGMMAIFTQLNQSLITTNLLRDKTLATWIALDRITELRINRQFPRAGEQSDDIEIAGQEWAYTVKTQQTPLESIRRIDVSVARAAEPKRILAEITGFLRQPGTGDVQIPTSNWTVPSADPAEGITQ